MQLDGSDDSVYPPGRETHTESVQNNRVVENLNIGGLRWASVCRESERESIPSTAAATEREQPAATCSSLWADIGTF